MVKNVVDEVVNDVVKDEVDVLIPEKSVVDVVDVDDSNNMGTQTEEKDTETLMTDFLDDIDDKN
jgi:hypothetical protein